MWRARCLAHNLLAHPCAGVLWALAGERPDGRVARVLARLGERAHRLWGDAMEVK